MKFIKHLFELNKLNRFLKNKKNIVFYAESKNDWLYLGPIVIKILEKYTQHMF